MRECQTIKNNLVRVGAEVRFIMGGSIYKAEIVDKNDDYALISCQFGRFAAPVSGFSITEEFALQFGKCRQKIR